MKSLIPVLNLSHEYTRVLIDIERAGIHIDALALAEVKKQYEDELAKLKEFIDEVTREFNGGQTINFDSPQQLSELIYSRKVKDKKEWQRVFDIGTTVKNAVKKKKRPKYVDPKVFRGIVKLFTEINYLKTPRQCQACEGTGSYTQERPTKNGRISRRMAKCPACSGNGLQYDKTDTIAGFARAPKSHTWVRANGFATDKDYLLELANGSMGRTKEFFEALVRQAAVSFYLQTFVEPITNNVGRRDSLLHSQFMQCVTATGRLSSQSPNFQNLPRGNTFPIRRVITSRWVNGKIVKVDWSTLEFRAAVDMANDPQGIKDVWDKVDVHSFTSKTLTDAGQATDRQGAKPHTFKPLYGGTSGTDAEQTYYRAFLEKYARVKEWHGELCSQAVEHHWIQIPSGRVYAFPYAKRYPNGSVHSATQIKNYPVQGFATADIAPLGTVALWNELQKRSLRSKIILLVHDENVIDTHPDEVEQVVDAIKTALCSVPGSLLERFGWHSKVPYEFEISVGDNWLNTKKLGQFGRKEE